MAIKFFKDNKIKDLSNIGYLALATILDKTYPIGCYFETSDVNFNPNEKFVGEWIEDTKGLTLIGAYDEGMTRPGNDRIYITTGSTIGEATHKLTVNEIPAHSHNLIMRSGTGSATYGILGEWSTVVNNSDQIKSTGGSQTHNNVQPSIGVKRWHRVS